MSNIGTIDNPYLVAPDDWHENGVPWASYCKCSRCGCVEKSTFVFDFYADKPGDPFRCESCLMGMSAEQHVALLGVQDAAEKERQK